MYNVSDKGLAFVAGWEGFRSCPYRDAVGVWTIGYGETRGIGPNTPCITERAARTNLETRIDHDYLAPLMDEIRPAVRTRLRREERDALASFVYNVGIGAFKTSTLLRKLNRTGSRFYWRRKKAYREELPRWTNGGLLGLVKRRAAEVRLACEGDYSGRP
jgi:lysozyme